MISEKIELIGKGLYEDIPDELTLKSIPTASELDYVGSEDFEATMLDKILPKAIEEKINFRHLLEIDFQWICRCLRIINYGPYHTTNSIYCPTCNHASYGEYNVDLRTIDCKMLPEGFVNEIKITKDRFIDFDGDVTLKLMTIQDAMNVYKDKSFVDEKGRVNKDLARMCYMIKSIKNKKNLTPLEVKMMISNTFSSADYQILKEEVSSLTDYGLRAGGSTICPRCGSSEAAFIALVDDRFFRPSVGALRQWRDDKRSGRNENSSGDKTTAV